MGLMSETLKNPYCLFSHQNKQNKRYFQLLENGKIHDIGSDGHDNERFWELQGEQLVLLSIDKQETARFEFKGTFDDHIYWEGLHQGTLPLEIRLFKNRSDLFDFKTKFMSKYLIDYGALEVGEHTYGVPSLIGYDQGGKVIIGDYCSIGNGVQFITSNHRLDLSTTYPFKILESFYTEKPLSLDTDHFVKEATIVGNDVWIGNNAQIMAGVKIGDGAVIATGAVVTKDVEPYAIVGGNPAKLIRYRIEQKEKREAMQKIAWWNWSEDKIKANLDKIMSTDIESFISEFSTGIKEYSKKYDKAIVLAANYAYVDQVMTTIKSVMYHHRNVRFYVINSDFPNEWFAQLNKRLAVGDSRIENCRVTTDQISQYKTAISYTVFLRYFIADFVEEDRVIYMDCDMVATGDLTDLFTMDMKGYPIGAVRDHGGRIYYQQDMFNAGFLLIDNIHWKKVDMTQQLIALTNEYHDKVDHADQSILNMLFEKNWLELPFDYNFIVIHNHFVDYQLRNNQEYPTIIHYLSHRKPWMQLATQLYRDVWWFYNGLEWHDILTKKSLINLESKDMYPNGKPLNCLIYTSTAEIESIEYLIEQLPNVHFNIAARVEVSEGISRLLAYSNVTVYSGIFQLFGLDQALQKDNDILLDINYGEKTIEMLEFFQNSRKPIMSFDVTQKSDYGQTIYSVQDRDQMICDIKKIARNIKL